MFSVIPDAFELKAHVICESYGTNRLSAHSRLLEMQGDGRTDARVREYEHARSGQSGSLGL